MQKSSMPDINREGENKGKLIQKSRPLLSLSRSDLSLSELKILDLYLAHIDSRKPESRAVTLTKGEFEKALGVTKINKASLTSQLQKLYQPVEMIRDNENESDMVSLFERAISSKDEHGTWKITLVCTQSAMKYIFNIETLGYLKYRLSSTRVLTSRYSYVLFLYLENNRCYRKTWTVDLDELKKELQCDNSELYKEYWRFNQRILKCCRDEIQNKTKCRFSYEPVLKGKTVVAIRFILEDISEFPEQVIDEPQVLPEGPENDMMAFFSDACNNEFTPEQMSVILNAINPNAVADHPDGEQFARYHYLAKMFAKMQYQDAKKSISRRFEYFVKMLENDDQQRIAGSSGVGTSERRDLSEDELEAIRREMEED